MRGNCGKASMFGQDLPCVDDGNATEVSPSPLYQRVRTDKNRRRLISASS